MSGLRVAGWIFRPNVTATTVTLGMLIVLMGLGSWQVQRLHWKENLLATIDKRIHGAPVDIMAAQSDADYQPVTATGVFQQDHIFYLSATSLTGVAGYHVLIPLRIDDEDVVLVDRGWIPYAARKDGFWTPADPVTVKGILRLPERRLYRPHNDPGRDDWYWIDLGALANAANVPVLMPYVLEADATPNYNGLPVGGQTRVTLPNNHRIYAIIWFGLAFCLAIIYAIASFQKDDEDLDIVNLAKLPLPPDAKPPG